MKTDTLKKSLLDYAIKGRLSAKFRRENSGLNAFDELEIYNDKIREKRKNLEKELKTLEFKLKKAPTRHCETSAGSRGNPQTKHELKSQIQILKKELTKCKEITPLNLSKAPFEIPNSWAWVKLGDICEIFTGATPKTSNAENFGDFIPFLNPGDIDNNGNVIYSNRGLTEKGLKEARKIEANSILIVCIGGLIGKACLVDRECTCNQQINVAKPFFTEATLLYYFINSAYFQSTIKANSTGTATPIINKNLFEQILIPLPPLCEQQEIVKKLDLLVTLANDFAITKENLKRIEKRIEKSLLKLALEGSLSKLYRRSSPTLSAFNEIATYNDEIKQKRKNLEKELKKCEKEFKLEKDKEQKAFFKSQIQMLKKELTKCKEIIPLMTMDCHEVANATSRNDDLGYSSSSLRGEANHTPKTTNRLPQVSSETLAMMTTPPFEIPNSWAWVKLGDICEITMGQSPEQNQFIDFSPVSQAQNDKKACHTDLEQSEREVSQHTAFEQLPILDVKYLRGKGDKKLANSGNFVNANDRLILMDGENSGEIFITKEKGFLGSTLKKLEFSSLSQVEFMDFMLLCYKDFFKGNKKGAAIPHLDRKLFTNLSIPLPPLQEQEHITQILDTLFTLKKGLRVD
ncbi:restriction endonuclease subunit S [Campylobacter upsaliensis]